MKKALIGYTGFVGQNLLNQGDFNFIYNSKNINEIQGEEFDEIYCAGISAVKWKANKEPEADLAAVNGLLENLMGVKAKTFIHISTVDVYSSPTDIDEDTEINPEVLQPYGKHRLIAENFVKNNFKNTFIIRLPGLFGDGLKKNIIFDFMHNNCLDMINGDSVFQFYNLDYIYRDIEVLKSKGVYLCNFATEPVRVKDVAKEAFGLDFDGNKTNPPAVYDMKTKHAGLFGKETYLYNKNEVFEDIKKYVEKAKAAV